jgi:lipoprotein-anchoring transpeptidase ErfK/SrfK
LAICNRSFHRLFPALFLVLSTLILPGLCFGTGIVLPNPDLFLKTDPPVNSTPFVKDAGVTPVIIETVVYCPAKQQKLAQKTVRWLEENGLGDVSADVLDSAKPSRTTIYYQPEGKDTALQVAELLSVKEVREWNNFQLNATVCVVPGDDFDDIGLFANPALPDGDMTVLHQRTAPLDSPVAPADDAKPDGIYISLGRRALSLYAGGELKGTWLCAVGLPARPTPKGKFRVTSMLKNPDWSWQGRSIPPGPKNGLGSRFLGISKPSYGIHGTNDPESIGKALSHGCVRMHNRDAEALYDMVTVGTPVTIIE